MSLFDRAARRYSPLVDVEAGQTCLVDGLKSKRLWRGMVSIVGGLLFLNLLLTASNVYRGGSIVPEYHVATSQESATPDWSTFAYSQYVTNDEYLCNALMMFESLRRLGTKADLVMMYPREWTIDLVDNTTVSRRDEIGESPQENKTEEDSLNDNDQEKSQEDKKEGNGDDAAESLGDGATDLEEERARAVLRRLYESRLLSKARDEYGVRLAPIDVQHLSDDGTWADSFTKLLAFNQTAYSRILSLDSDATILRPMDELFLLPSAPIAMPRAYWQPKGEYSNQIMLVEPSAGQFEQISEAFRNRQPQEFDMDIVNHIYGDECLVIPHRRYGLLTGEFRSKDHRKYLGSGHEVWNPWQVLNETKYVHFSDWPLPKPWLPAPEEQLLEVQPACVPRANVADCSDREAWTWVYQDFRDRRESVCGMVP